MLQSISGLKLPIDVKSDISTAVNILLEKFPQNINKKRVGTL